MTPEDPTPADDSTTPVRSPLSDRDAELLAGAVSGDLTPEEADVLDRRLLDDPDIRAEYESLVALDRELRAVHSVDAAPSVALEGRVMAQVRGEGVPAARPRFHALRLVAAAIGLLGVLGIGVVGGRLLTPVIDGSRLGEAQVVVFDTTEGVDLQAAVVAHTWGTELRMELDGLPAGEAFRVTYTDEAGSDVEGGTFLGSEVTVICQLNAAVLLTDISGIRITDAAGASVATTAI